MRIGPFGLGTGLILLGLAIDRKKLMRATTLEAHEGEFMAEKLTKSKINYTAWASGLSAMKKWKSYDKFLTHLATGAQPRDTKEYYEQVAIQDYQNDMQERRGFDEADGVFFNGRMWTLDEEVPVWDLVENEQCVGGDLKGLMTPVMAETLGRTYVELMKEKRVQNNLYRNAQDTIWTLRNKGIPHKKTGRPTSKTMTVYYRYQPSTGEVMALGLPDYGFKDYYDVRFKNGQRITTNEYDALMADTMAILSAENSSYNYHILRQQEGEEVDAGVIAKVRKDAMDLKSNRRNTLTGAERKLLRKTYLNSYFNGGANPITGRDMRPQTVSYWDESKKYKGDTLAKGLLTLNQIVYALQCSKVLPDVKTLRKSSNRRNASYKPSKEAFEDDEPNLYQRRRSIVSVNNYDFMPHLETMEKWQRFNEIARATPQIQNEIDRYQKRIDENQAIIDKYESMDIQEEINTRVAALKQQLSGEYGLEREKQQAIERAKGQIRMNESYLKEEKEKLDSLMNS